MVRLLRIYFAMQAAHLRAQLQYEADVWLALIGVALGQIVGALFISSLFRLRPALGGWSIWEAAVPYGLIGLARGLSELLCEGLWHIRTIVARGELDVPLVRPLPLVFQIATRASDLHSLSNLIIGSSIIGLAFHRLGLVLSAAKIIFFVFTMAGSTLVMAAMILIANSIAFWDRSVDSSLPSFVLQIADGAQIPLSVYGAPVRVVLTWILPYAFVSYFPAQVLLGKPVTPLAWASPLIGPLVAGLACMIFRLGLRRYESAGH